MSEPKWLIKARSYLGTKEIPGKNFNPIIKKWFAYAGHKEVTDDVTPWCAAFANAMLYEAGQKGTGALNARSFLNWGSKLTKPKVGCIVVFKRGNSSWQGHVAFFLRDLGDRIEVLGGNQSDSVSIGRYKKTDLLGYRWPDTLSKSSVVKGASGTIAGGSAITIAEGAEVVSKLQEADSYISAGTWIGLVVGVSVVAFGLWAMYARWKAGGKPVPEWFPSPVKRFLGAT